MANRYTGHDIALGTDASGKPVVWKGEHQRTHLYVTGVTRSGKSRFVRTVIQQAIDINWRNQQGLLLLDAHGELSEGVLGHIASTPSLWSRPIILIDLRRDDYVVSYNLVRARSGLDPAVVATGFVEALTHAFGGDSVTDTPRLARVARFFIQALLDTGRTLSDVLPLLAYENKAAREALIAELPNSSAREFFAQFSALARREFDATVESFANRMSSFLSNRLLGHMFGQRTTASFDFSRAIEDGAIVLVNLATKNGKVAEPDAKLFAMLLLTDLWQAAKLRGKAGAGLLKPFLVFADEFQNFLTPTIAHQLDQAAGFGLHFVLAHQHPGQLLDYGGEHGRAIFNSVMANARTKVAFQASEQDEQRAPLVAALFDGVVDVNRVALSSVQTVGHREVRRILHGGSDAKGTSKTTGKTTSKTTSRGRSLTSSSTEGEGEGSSETSAYGRSSSRGHVTSSGTVLSDAHSVSSPGLSPIDSDAPGLVTVSDVWGGSESSGSAHVESDSASESDATTSSTNSFRATTTGTTTQRSKSKGVARSESTSRSRVRTSSWQEQITLEPILEERPTQFMSVENQHYAFGQILSNQPPRHAHVRLPGSREPVAFVSLDCPEATVAQRFVDRIATRIIARMECALPMGEAAARLRDISSIAPPAATDEVLRQAAAGQRRTRRGPKESDHG